MRKQFLTRSYEKLSDAKLEIKAQIIIASLTGNPYFATPPPFFSECMDANEIFTARLSAAASRDRVAITLKNEAREILLKQMQLLALNVESISGGNISVLTSTGFTLSSANSHNAPIGAPTDFQLSDGKNSGEMKFSVKKVANAKFYIFQYTTGPLTAESQWISRGVTLKEYTYNNLTVGDRLYCRVAVIGSRGQEVYSPILSRIVQ